MSETYQKTYEKQQKQQSNTKQVFGLSDREIDELRERARENSKLGTWKQKGPYLVKEDVEYPFRIHIGTNKQMIGIDGEGKPILKNLDQ